jgi:UDP-N-acetylglucosamine diphosphorylase / glucose-1-phosphate thymidylyltransferase / UDP-N-acetylgalactosamine diphosphorylase / glucosamine-1-phosphate N-acetyltransferase / galactosamine-1-phosphate N-acetyltransferase
MSILLFEDATVSQLAPITTARPAYCITLGSYHLLDFVRTLGLPLVAHIRPYLQAIHQLDYADVQLVGDESLDGTSGPSLVLNARIEPTRQSLQEIQRLLRMPHDARAPRLADGPQTIPQRAEHGHQQSGIVWSGDQIAAIVQPGWTWETIGHQGAGNIESLLLTVHDLPDIEAALPLMNFPHEVIAANMRGIRENLEHRIGTGQYQQQADGVFVAEGAELGEYVITETAGGPIIIDQHAKVGPYTLLRGPIYIGPGARILEHAAIKDEVSIGHTTKVGGEVEAAIIESYTNKQHHGFLGHSYLGSWINLGAGTCNSDLKNTYGTVNMEYPHGKAATGMQFLGCVMGDYSKTAINTGIFTGKVIGVCSMMYGFVTSNVPSFVNYARLFGQMTTLPPEVMIATQQRMFSRRKVEQRPCDMQLLHDMYRLTQCERDRFGEAIAF